MHAKNCFEVHLWYLGMPYEKGGFQMFEKITKQYETESPQRIPIQRSTNTSSTQNDILCSLLKVRRILP